MKMVACFSIRVSLVYVTTYKDLEPAFPSFSGKVVVCILEQKLTSDTSSCGSRKECVGICNVSSDINNILEFASR